jgi:hypothetical protein
MSTFSKEERMRKTVTVLALLLFWPLLAAAEVINVEFKFTPFVGDPAKADQVETVPGKASVYLNNMPLVETELDRREVPVLFEEREIASSVWLPVKSVGPVLRKGKNKIRIEFEPSDPKLPYRARFSWASVTDQVARVEDGPGRVRETNQSDEGVDDRNATGRTVFEREFVADFATDLPWHHYPPVTTLSDEDKKSLSMLVKERIEAFKPNFAAVYQMLKGNQNLDLAGIKKSKCLDKGYAAGIRVATPSPDQLEFVATGNPEVVIRGKTGNLYYPVDQKSFDRIKDNMVQMCIGMVFSALYPPRLVVVRSASGKWETVY